MTAEPLPTIGSLAWQRALERALKAGPELHFQPIVDLRRGVVVGYETLARFAGPPYASPDKWFAAAQEHGLALNLEEQVWRQAIATLILLPQNAFLSLNASPDFLSSPACAALVESAPSLSRLVIEVTEHDAIADYERFGWHLQRYRAAGAQLAVDDAGAGYASMSHILALRPQFVKLDATFVQGCDRDPAKAALIDMVGRFAGHLDAWLLAEGIERREELDTLLRLKVPLGQGYLLARPEPDWPELPPEVRRRMRVRALDLEGLAVRALIAPAQSIPAGTHEPVTEDGIVVTVDQYGRPLELIHWRDGSRRVFSPMRIKGESHAEPLLRRALIRPEAERFEPLVCIDDEGVYTGILRIESLIDFLLSDRAVARDTEA